jgi:phosphate transport system permease protein
MKKVSTGSKIADKVFKVATGLCASSPVLFLAAIAIIVFIESIPTIRFMGWDFLTQITWNMGNMYGAMVTKHGVTAPAGASYGALPFIVGTLASSVIALVIAVPVSIFTAVILAYRVRGVLRNVLSILVELLAGLPSVVIGLWGVVVLAPWVASSFGPFLSHLGGIIPYLRGPVGSGMGLLTSGIILALMIIPIITSTTRDLLMTVPVLYREGGIGLGMTSWEVVRLICIPFIKEGLVGAIALGWGRAMGETMAVLMVSGSAINYLPHNIFSPISTMAAVIADQLDSAMTDASHMAVHALAELALILMVLTFVTNLVARLLVNRSRGRRQVGAGVKA